MNDDLRNHNNQRRKPKTWTTEDNQHSLRCCFRSNSSQRWYRKRMIEIWQEYASFQTTSQRLADQVRTIIKKDWFSYLEILEIHQKINNEQNNDIIPDTSIIIKQKQPYRDELHTSENGNATQTKKKRTTKQPKRNTITRTKSKSRKFKENYEQWKVYLNIINKQNGEQLRRKRIK